LVYLRHTRHKDTNIISQITQYCLDVKFISKARKCVLHFLVGTKEGFFVTIVLYIHTYHSRFILVGVAEIPKIFLRDPHVLPKLFSYEWYCRRGKSIATWSQSISGVSALNHLVAFYDIHGRKREVLLFYFVSDTTRDRLLS
jgi:hypothetical protein